MSLLNSLRLPSVFPNIITKLSTSINLEKLKSDAFFQGSVGGGNFNDFKIWIYSTFKKMQFVQFSCFSEVFEAKKVLEEDRQEIE